MNRFKKEVQKFQTSANGLMTICKKLSCEPEILNLQHLLQHVEESMGNLSDILGNRVERNWYSILQDAVKVIHGFINTEEMKNYEDLIRDKVNNNQARIDETQGKIQILTSNLTRQNNKFVGLEYEVNELKTQVNTVLKTQKLTEEIYANLKIMEHIQAMSSFGLFIQQDIQNIITAIMFAKRNTVHPSVLSAKKLLSELIIATKYKPNNLHFPYALLDQNTEGIITLADIKAFRINELLIFVASNPLTVDEIFDLYKLIPYPSKFRNEQFIYVKPKEDYLLINEQRTTFSLASNTDTCKHVHRELLICKFEKPLFTRLKNRICEVELLTEPKVIPKNCDLRIIRLETEIWEKLHFFNT